MNDNYDIFISYSRKDKAIAEQICSACDDAGISYFIDRSGIHSGQNFIDVIIKAIRRSSIFLFLASENAYKSQITQDEVFEALDYVAQGKCIIVTYIIDGSKLPDSLRFRLRRFNWRDMCEHSIKGVLIPDLFTLLGRSPNHVSKISEDMKRQAEEWYDKGDEYYNEGDYKRAVECYTKAAEQGNARAQCKLGSCYAYGSLDEVQNYEKAIKWFTKAAEQGFTNAQVQLGLCYENGRGVEQSYEKAVEWYTRAAEQDDTTAQICLGRMYEEGQVILQDYTKAMKWYARAAKKGDVRADDMLKKLKKKTVFNF